MSREIIDLSQSIKSGMPVHHTQPEVNIDNWSFHADSDLPSSKYLQFSEHTGTHVDAMSHMMPDQSLLTIDQMPLNQFMGRAFCVDLSHLGIGEEITQKELYRAIDSAHKEIRKGDIFLMYTDHYRKHYGTNDWPNGPGLTIDAAQWLVSTGISAFGVETMAPGIKGVTNTDVHLICGQSGITHYENLVNLHQLINRDYFTFIGLPLNIKGGTGSPVRAIALF